MEWLDSFWATYSTLVLSVGTNILLALSIYLTLACGLADGGQRRVHGHRRLYGGVADDQRRHCRFSSLSRLARCCRRWLRS